MPRKSTPAHQRKSGPGTGGRNWERDKKICVEKKATGASNVVLGEKYGLSRQAISNIINAGERNEHEGRTEWTSAAERRDENKKK